MTLDQPLRFYPIFKERVWGGRELARFGRKLPAGEMPIGESWEIVDRPEAQSIVTTGPLTGKTLNELWNFFREPIFGCGLDKSPRFPLLIKLLDARERLSLQVHPPAQIAPALGGEPKTECWFLLDAEPNAQIYAGLKKGVTPEKFKAAIQQGQIEPLVHHFPVKSGDALFIPSGRLHAIGAGNIIIETQQNSDTTYRVFDWNRLGLDGKPRDLHIEESLASIDFNDFEPSPISSGKRSLIECHLFVLERLTLHSEEFLNPIQRTPGRFSLLFLLQGSASLKHEVFQPFDLFLVPAQADTPLRAGAEGAVLLRISLGSDNP